jgi:head-tail adaptor
MPPPDPNAVSIGSLRWPVVIATRAQAADPDTAGILETYKDNQTVRADVQPMGPMTFYAAEQVDRPVTHKIVIRWLDWMDATCVIFRVTRRPDGTSRIERFRVRRVMEVDGRKRFLRCDCELEERA